MVDALHRTIAHHALEAGFIDADTLSEAMLEIGRLQSQGEDPGAEIWAERGWLDEARLAQITHSIVGQDPGAAGPGAMRARELEEFVRAETAFLSGAADADEHPNAAIFDRMDTALAEGSARSVGDAASDAMTLAFEVTEGEVDEEGLESESFDSQMHTLVRAADGELDEDTFGVDEAGAAQPGEGHEMAQADTALQDQPSASTLLDPGQRFTFGEELGRGGAGKVIRAFDRVLGRTIAMKILRPELQSDDKILARFIAEAQATGQLEHPNIVPVYDFGVLPSGELYYTMREVGRHSLREVFRRFQDGEGEAGEEYTLVGLLSMLRQVCQAVHYAHTRGVIHRDLKPDNIMLGEYGEVLVMDWGLARVLDREVRTDLSRIGGERHRVGETLGTPAYMPPEQARGELDAVDEQSDIYSLGAILYEILTHQPPFVGQSAAEIMNRVVAADLVVPSERAPADRVVPDELERMCLKAMAPLKEARYTSALELSEDLEDWLEGIQPREAARRVQRGDAAAQRYRELREQVERLEARCEELAGRVEPWQPIDQKRELWRFEDRCDELDTASVRAFGEAVTGYTQALAYQPENQRARRGLAELYLDRFEEAEKRGDELDAIYYRALVREYDTGALAAALEQTTSLALSTEPSQASATLFAFESYDRRMVAGEPRELGQTPLSVEGLDVGSYLLVLTRDEQPPVRAPLLLERSRPSSLTLQLPTAEQAEQGFLFVPAGEYIAGGDPKSFAPRSPQRVHVDPFFCAQFPVTFREYLQWFNRLYREEGDAVMPRAPQTRDSDGMLIRLDEDKNLWVPDEILIEGPARKMYPVGEGHEWDLPVVGIRAEDAEAYCRWRGERDGRPYRLPSEHELEKAGRGVDGRFFPWGDRFDATFCKMRFSRPENPQLEPVGTFVDDVSPYGIRDLAGGVQEWCAGQADSEERPVKGGGWNQDVRVSRMASRISLLAGGRTAGVGFRMVYSPK